MRIINGLIIAGMLMCPLAAYAEGAQPSSDKRRRIEEFQAFRLIVETDQDKRRMLRQGPDRIYDVDLVTLFDDPSLTADYTREQAFDFARWLGTAALGIPMGSNLFIDNFRGEGAFALIRTGTSASNAAHPLAFAASTTGMVLTLWGVYQFSLWLAELLDQHHPNRLEDVSIQPRITAYNDALRERLELDPADIPPPPTPRPSPTQTPSATPRAGISAPVGGPDGQAGGVAPSIRPQPIDTLTPGTTPPELIPTPRPGTTPFRFPVMPRYEAPPSPPPSPAPSPSV